MLQPICWLDPYEAVSCTFGRVRILCKYVSATCRAPRLTELVDKLPTTEWPLPAKKPLGADAPCVENLFVKSLQSLPNDMWPSWIL